MTCNRRYLANNFFILSDFSSVLYSILYASLCRHDWYVLYRFSPLQVYFLASNDTLPASATKTDDRANQLLSINPNVRVIFLQIFPIWLLCRIFLLFSVSPKYKYYQVHNVRFDRVLPSWVTFRRTYCSLTWSAILFSGLSSFRKLLDLDLLIVISRNPQFIGFSVFSRACSRRQLKSLKSFITKFW